MMMQKNVAGKKVEKETLKRTVETGKRRIEELDMLISRIYEDNVTGKLSDERYARMAMAYEKEQKELIQTVNSGEKQLLEMDKDSIDMRTLLKALREITNLKELTPTIVNTLIQRIEVHNNDKSSGHCHVKVDIYFTAAGLISIPTEQDIMALMKKIKDNPQAYKTAV